MPGTQSIGLLQRSWLSLESRTLRRLGAIARRKSSLPEHLLTGIEGEREAIFYLRRHGYTIVARRWRSAKQRGDLDLIAWHEDTLCFIEIKTRSRRDFVPAEAAVDDDKQRTLQSLARVYIRRLPEARRESPMRFDVLSVYMQSDSARQEPDFVLYQGAFSWK